MGYAIATVAALGLGAIVYNTQFGPRFPEHSICDQLFTLELFSHPLYNRTSSDKTIRKNVFYADINSCTINRFYWTEINAHGHRHFTSAIPSFDRDRELEFRKELGDFVGNYTFQGRLYLLEGFKFEVYESEKINFPVTKYLRSGPFKFPLKKTGSMTLFEFIRHVNK